ncbi:hypothetical protein, partial [Rosistilla oblonga]|uniref:hypothetical protein n=1 Tax=Rosistilla oblonga TaxID=2527990 RepID=UPI003A97CF95
NSNWKNVEISAGLADRPLLENASQRWEPGLTPKRLIKPTSRYRVAADSRGDEDGMPLLRPVPQVGVCLPYNDSDENRAAPPASLSTD